MPFELAHARNARGEILSYRSFEARKEPPGSAGPAWTALRNKNFEGSFEAKGGDSQYAQQVPCNESKTTRFGLAEPGKQLFRLSLHTIDSTTASQCIVHSG